MVSYRLPLTSTCLAVWITASPPTPSISITSPQEPGHRLRRCHLAMKRLPARLWQIPASFIARMVMALTRLHRMILRLTRGRRWLARPMRKTTDLHPERLMGRCSWWAGQITSATLCGYMTLRLTHGRPARQRQMASCWQATSRWVNSCISLAAGPVGRLLV
jgi:hypothetical protein